MFKNPGKKIRRIAIILFVLFSVACIVVGIWSIPADFAIIGIPIMIAGPILAYIFALFLVGYGDLVENSAKQAANEEDKEIKTIPNYKSIKIVSDKTQHSTEISCPQCGASQFNDRNTCFSCGTKLQ